ncbi:molybdate ABC transporter substrate-binding protein [Microbacterium sp. NPDC076768]|uniref:molybdate ABC transporter substrate-binding protein n=1 Tax=Microbacterium sp. NPDC076768 TaxID=3154858 RepID=UPI0034323B6F
MMSQMMRIVQCAAVAVIAGALAGCAGGAEPPASSSNDTLQGELTIYAAASLAESFDAIGEAFTAEHPEVRLSAVYDGSATLVTQILEGAPADVFATADEASMAKAADLMVSPTLFASNTLVIAVPAGNPAGVESLGDLAEVTTVLCAPEVPCGAASEELLSISGVAVDPASIEQNVTAVLTKVAADEADAGLIYATDALRRDDIDVIVPDEAAQVVNHYPIAALADAANPAAARAFVAFVESDAGQQVLTDFGFGAP